MYIEYLCTPDFKIIQLFIQHVNNILVNFEVMHDSQTI